jgi:hypothetical protein
LHSSNAIRLKQDFWQRFVVVAKVFQTPPTAEVELARWFTFGRIGRFAIDLSVSDLLNVPLLPWQLRSKLRGFRGFAETQLSSRKLTAL